MIQHYTNKISLCLLVTLVIGQPIFAQQNTHVYNDYNQSIPFWNAITVSADVIEIDIFLKNCILKYYKKHPKYVYFDYQYTALPSDRQTFAKIGVVSYDFKD